MPVAPRIFSLIFKQITKDRLWSLSTPAWCWESLFQRRKCKIPIKRGQKEIQTFSKPASARTSHSRVHSQIYAALQKVAWPSRMRTRPTVGILRYRVNFCVCSDNLIFCPFLPRQNLQTVNICLSQNSLSQYYATLYSGTRYCGIKVSKLSISSYSVERTSNIKIKVKH